MSSIGAARRLGEKHNDPAILAKTAFFGHLEAYLGTPKATCTNSTQFSKLENLSDFQVSLQ